MLSLQDLWVYVQNQQSQLEMFKNQIALLESRIEDLEKWLEIDK